MKNLISILFITIYLFGGTEFGQIFNLPELVSHYKQHQSENHKINFLRFIVMHYFTDDGIASDDGQDSKLPFKQIHLFSFELFEIPARQELQTDRKFFEIGPENILYDHQTLQTAYHKVPLHPPRITS